MIELVPLWDDFRELICPAVDASKPQCYVRLKAFSDEMAAIIGPRFVSVDLDCLVRGNLDAVFGRAEDFVIWRRAPVDDLPESRMGKYQGSMFMMTAGARRKIWSEFHGEETLKELAKLPEPRKWLYTDQGWLNYRLGKKEATWTMADGVYDWRWIKQEGMPSPPANAAIIFFPGPEKPWNLLDVGWIRENYQ